MIMNNPASPYALGKHLLLVKRRALLNSLVVGHDNPDSGLIRGNARRPIYCLRSTSKGFRGASQNESACESNTCVNRGQELSGRWLYSRCARSEIPLSSDTTT